MMDGLKLLTITLSIFTILALLLAMFGMVMAISSAFMKHDIQIVETECYDRFGNEVDDLTCSKKVGCNYKWNLLNNVDCLSYTSSGGQE